METAMMAQNQAPNASCWNLSHPATLLPCQLAFTSYCFKVLYKIVSEEGILLIQIKAGEPLVEFNLSTYQRQEMSPRKETLHP